MKLCETCHTPIVKRSRDGLDAYNARRYCSSACKGDGQRKPRDESLKLCANPACRQPLAIRRDTESITAFAKRSHCSHKCAIATRKARMWADRRRDRAAHAGKIPAATEAEWLRLNGGPTICPPMYAAPVEHAMYARHALTGSGRVR